MIIRVNTVNGFLSNRTMQEIHDKVATLGDGFFEIRIDRIPPVRVSERLRRYYWSLCRLIARYLTETGHMVDEHTVHQHNAEKYMSLWFMNFDTMQTYQDRYSHIFLDNDNLKKVCEMLQQFWAERGLYLPDPHEADSFDFDNPPTNTTK